MSLQQILGLGSYETAWVWMHKLRRTVVRPGRNALRGRVEVDETFVGGEETGTAQRGRGGVTKAFVAIAAEENGLGIGRVRMARIPNATRRSLHDFLPQAVEPGSVVHFDGLPAYAGMEALGYAHEPTVLLGKGKDAATQLLPRVHRVASLLKRWLLGTHQGAVSPEHLDYYLDEFTFRFNRRTSHRGANCSTGSSSKPCKSTRPPTKPLSVARLTTTGSGRWSQGDNQDPCSRLLSTGMNRELAGFG